MVSNIQSISKSSKLVDRFKRKPLQKPYQTDFWDQQQELRERIAVETKLDIFGSDLEAAFQRKPDKRRPFAHLLQLAGANVGASRTNPTQDVEHRDRDVAAVGNLNCLSLACPAQIEMTKLMQAGFRFSLLLLLL